MSIKKTWVYFNNCYGNSTAAIVNDGDIDGSTILSRCLGGDGHVIAVPG